MMRPLLRPVGPLPASAYWIRRSIVLVALGLFIWWVVALLVPDGPDRSAAAGLPTPTPTPTAPAVIADPDGGAGAMQRPGASQRDGSGQGSGSGDSFGEEEDAQRGGTGGQGGSARTSPPATGTNSSRTERSTATATPKVRTPRTPSPPVRPAACDPGRLGVEAEIAKSPVAAGQPVAVTLRLRNGASAACQLAISAKTLRVEVTSGNDQIWDTADCSAVPDAPLVLGPREQRELTIRWPGVRSREGCPGGQPAALPGYYAATASVGGVTASPARFRLT
jgi:hypothetical protein